MGGDTHDLPRIPRWHRDRMIIIGDAAHAASPSSGQGASMAIEDAVVLTKCLRDLRDPDAAFTAYAALRRPRVERVVAMGARSSSAKAPGPIGRLLRDMVLPVVLRHLARKSQGWLFDHHLDWNARIEVPAQAA